MTVYALIICVSGYCSIHGQPHNVANNVFVEAAYRTLAECLQAMRSNSAKLVPNKNHLMKFQDGSTWECRGKHVETWEPVRQIPYSGDIR
jgi:hypothetical protein